MPRKLYRNPEITPTPERPGPGTREDSGVQRRSQPEPSVIIDPRYAAEIPVSTKVEIEPAYQEEIKANKRQKEQKEKEKALWAEREDLNKRIEEMGGVWGGEAYFVLSERLEEIDKMLGVEPVEEVSQSVEAPSGLTEESLIAGELTPEEQIADARKTLKFIEDSERETEERQKKLQRKLAKHGLKSTTAIHKALERMEHELREHMTGTKPGFWLRAKSIGNRLAGLEPSPEMKELLKEYVNLETEMNAHIHSRTEAETELRLAEEAAGRERKAQPRIRISPRGSQVMSGMRGGSADVSAGGSMEGYLKTFGSAPEAHRGTKEVQTILAMKKIQEDIEEAITHVDAYRDLTETELSEDLFSEKKAKFARRIRALEELGGGAIFDEALEEAEESLMRYVMKVHERQKKFVEETKAVAPDVVRPRSVIAARPGRSGTYGTSAPERRVVRLSERAQTERERAVELERRAPERVNKEIETYRSMKWRKSLIDKINTDDLTRQAMHGVYEAFKHRMLEKLANEEELNFRTGSPDPALDYALNLYRYYAKRRDGKGYVYDRAKRLAAHEELEEADAILGKKWDPNGFAATAVRLISHGKETSVKTLEQNQEIEAKAELSPVAVQMLNRLEQLQPNSGLLAELKKTLGMAGNVDLKGLARQYALLHKSAEEGLEYAKRRITLFDLNVKEADGAKEEEIPIEVEAPITMEEWKAKQAEPEEEIPIEVEAPVSSKERPLVTAEEAEASVGGSTEEQKRIDEAGAQSFEDSLEDDEVREVRDDELQEVTETPRSVPSRKREKAFDTPEQEAAARKEIEEKMGRALQNEERARALEALLGRYKPDQNASLADAMVALYAGAVGAQAGARKRVMSRHAQEAWDILNAPEPAPIVERSEEEERLEKIEERVKTIRGNGEKLAALREALKGIGGRSITERVNNLFKAYLSARGKRKKEFLLQLNDVRTVLGLDIWAEPTRIPPSLKRRETSSRRSAKGVEGQSEKK